MERQWSAVIFIKKINVRNSISCTQRKISIILCVTGCSSLLLLVSYISLRFF
jgi:hypothetical protein